MLEAQSVDQQLFAHTYVNGLWHVHSMFKNSFNLQNQQSKQLIMLTFQSVRVPHGITVSYADYLQLTAQLRVDMPIMAQQRVLYFPQAALSFQDAYSYETTWSASEQSVDQNHLFSVIKQVEKETGFQEPLQQVFTSRHAFYQAIDSLHDRSFYKQRQAIDFLIGRGIGLTPTGDDMLVGTLLARYLTQQQDQRLDNYLKRKITAVHDLTTDVSQHYLLQAIEGNFSQTYAKVGRCRDQQTAKDVIQTIFAIGHTSGADFLAGFVRSLLHVKH
ncbi:DUF2877 domain-containing protein [Enterococcus sp. DIV0876]|uniref:DUF2877 domain-containing protein n=1 Tax=Enterococcus sp. DIV0876 TaxID=2774633 RepID=UPI003D2FE448